METCKVARARTTRTATISRRTGVPDSCPNVVDVSDHLPAASCRTSPAPCRQRVFETRPSSASEPAEDGCTGTREGASKTQLAAGRAAPAVRPRAYMYGHTGEDRMKTTVAHTHTANLPDRSARPPLPHQTNPNPSPSGEASPSPLLIETGARYFLELIR